MTTTSREILTDVLSGRLSLQEAGPALREASIKDAYCLLANQEQDGTYTLMNIAQGADLQAALFSKPYLSSVSEEAFSKHYRRPIMGLFKQGKVYRKPGQLEDPKEFLSALESLFRCHDLQGGALDLSSLTDAELRILVDVKETARIQHGV